MNYATMFSWHPAYSLIHQHITHHNDKLSHVFEPDELISVQILRKEELLLNGNNPFI